MAKFSRQAVYQKIYETGFIPMFYEPDLSHAKTLLKSCYNGGARLIELTNRGDFAHENFGELVKWSAKEFPDLMLGAGTIVDAATAALYIQLGANFIVTPVLHEDIAKICNRRMIPWLSGCATLSEISKAQEWGAEIVKVFPGDVLSPNFVKGALGPMPWTKMMITGGVDATTESIKSWFDAGATCVGLGSKVFPKGASPHAIEEKIRFCVETIKAISR